MLKVTRTAYRFGGRPERLVRDGRIIRSVFHPPRAITIGAVKPAFRAIVAPFEA